MKIGVLGGTFDPIHIGHLIIAEEARLRLGLGEVIFVPAGQPYFKGGKAIAPAQCRLEMTRLAISSNPYFQVSSIEVDRPGPSYTVDTIAALRNKLGAGAEIFFIMGADALMELPLWKEPARILAMCRLVAVRRPGRIIDLSSLDSSLPGASARIVFLDAPEIGISSTEIRSRVSRGLSIRYLVPEEVEEYIRRNGLYLSPQG